MHDTTGQNPEWPAEMRFFVSIRSPLLLELLYVRAAFAVPSTTNLPPAQLPVAKQAMASGLVELAQEWDDQWQHAVAWELGAVDRESSIHAFLERPDRAAIAALLPTRWTDTDNAHFDRDLFNDWQAGLAIWNPPSFEDLPEQRSSSELRAAWERGLRIVIPLPVQGSFGHQVGTNGVVLSEASYNSPPEFSAILNTFGPRDSDVA